MWRQCLGLVLGVTMATGAVASSPAERVREAVVTFQESLNEAQRGEFATSFDDDARIGWSFFPGERKGIKLGTLDEAQQELVLAVLRAGLSATGYEKAETIRSLEDVLGGSYNTGNYYLALFGEPSENTPWGLRWEGHHLSLNWTVVEGRVVASTPQFLGANPAEVKAGPMKGTRALKAEEDLARTLVKGLDETQRKQAVISDTAPADILTRMDREAAIQENLGVAYKDLSPEHQGLLLSLIQTYADVMPEEIREERLTKIREAGMDEVKFAWMGGLEPGEGHYYRVQGTTFLIEYDNTQGNANHIHTVWRDFDGDFGRDVLKEHYKAHADAEHPHEHRH